MRMRTMKLTLTVALGAFSLAGLVQATTQSVALAADTGTPMHSTSEVVHSTATVTSIDKKARTVLLKKDDGDTVSVQVPTEMTGFDRLKVGDKVDVDYHEAIAV